MELLIEAFVFVIQLALAGFLVWGAWLCLEYRLRGERISPADAEAPPAPAVDFERVASLVLLALLFTAAVDQLRGVVTPN